MHTQIRELCHILKAHPPGRAKLYIPQPLLPEGEEALDSNSLSLGATVYTDLGLDCEFIDLAPLTPPFWGSEFKVPQNGGFRGPK